MQVEALEIPDVKRITPARFGDDRGFFSEVYNENRFQDAGIRPRFVQQNQSYSRDKGTLRGLHFQSPPHAQAKLVRVVAGAILDVAVDIRQGSPFFGQHVTAILTAENGAQLFVPAGFLHGFITIEPETQVIYLVDDYYAPECDGSIRFDDTELAVDWRLEEFGLSTDNLVLSGKDQSAIGFSAFENPFHYTDDHGGNV